MAACATDSCRPHLGSPTLADSSLGGFSSRAATGVVLKTCARTIAASASTEIPRGNVTNLVNDFKSATTNSNPPANTKASWFESPNPFLFMKRSNVCIVDKEIDEKTRDRFRAMQPSFEKLLLEYIRAHRKPGTRYTPMSTRLAMMGTSENDARPYILILCQPAQKSIIQGFTRQEIVRDMCRPGDLGVPSLEVLVLGKAPRLHLAHSEIEVTTDTTLISEPVHFTLCGVPISFTHPNGQRRNATFGGIIKVMAGNGSTEFLGITAGHMLRDWENEEPYHKNSNSDALDADNYDCEVDEKPVVSSETGYAEGKQTQPWEFEETTVLGRIIDVANINKPRYREKYYDWTLFQPTRYAMNYATTKSHISLSDERPGSTGTRDVLVLSGSSGRKEGTLSSQPGRILLEGDEFIDTFMLTIHGDDSGELTKSFTSSQNFDTKFRDTRWRFRLLGRRRPKLQSIRPTNSV